MLPESKMRVRIAGIFVKDGKLLFLKGRGHEELWTTGGKMEGSETDEECLRRELKEEIGVEMIESTFYKEYHTTSFYHPDTPIVERVYIISITGNIMPQAEIENFVWLSKDDFYRNTYPMIPHIEKELLPSLIEDKIW